MGIAGNGEEDRREEDGEQTGENGRHMALFGARVWGRSVLVP